MDFFFFGVGLELTAREQNGGSVGPSLAAWSRKSLQKHELTVILRLLSNWRNQIVLLCNLRCLHDLCRAPLARAPVVSKIHVDCLCEALNDLLHRCGVVGTMGENNIDIWLLETLQRGLETLNDVLLAQTTSVGLLAACTEEYYI
jgi:hypothetical protein